MKLRLKNNKLIDDDGRVLGRVTEMVIELEPPAAEVLGQPQLPIESADVVQDVWAHYVQVMAPRNKGLGDEERRVIRQALKVATASELKEAISGCGRSEFHMRSGEYAGRPGPKYNRLSQIIKGKQGKRTTREQIDFFLDIARKVDGQALVVSGDPVKVRDAKNDVLAAHEFPDDEHTVRRGSEARRWLEEQGWTIGVRESDQWPTFTPPGSV